jgi:cell shape-determining protein MreC
VELSGLGNGAFEFYLNKEFPIKRGDTVFYKYYPVAIVQEVEKDNQSPYVRVLARLPFNINILDYVLIKSL